ncbi:hypothetical protein DPMN_079372 [Dreissena polymorpha]|uniref:Uncharacterized protein n=1 Tax=Dreissena polymorpha TaxID=45954 RepID=A0A9D3YQM2_DREPO|nr:hypothetical protein DPMN_079372 [Dreissena polymorpha]
MRGGRLTPRDPIQGARPSSNTLSNTLQKWQKVKKYFAPDNVEKRKEKKTSVITAEQNQKMQMNKNVKRKTLATVAEEAEHQNSFKDLSSIIKKLAEKYAKRKMPLTKDRRRLIYRQLQLIKIIRSSIHVFEEFKPENVHATISLVNNVSVSVVIIVT